MSTIEDDARRRGIGRLCHFTKSSNLAHILSSGEIRSVAQLQREINGFRASDVQRLDGYLDHICCTIEYPNAWYLDRARSEDPNFLDWVILELSPEMLWREAALFAPFNAARGNGANVTPGVNGYRAMFAPEVTGQRRFVRGPQHPAWWPTDDQAEALIPGPIPLRDVRKVIVKDHGQAAREYRRVRHNNQVDLLPPLVVAPVLFDKYKLSEAVRNGRRPQEVPVTGLAE